jgi:hypothetical protein
MNHNLELTMTEYMTHTDFINYKKSLDNSSSRFKCYETIYKFGVGWLEYFDEYNPKNTQSYFCNHIENKPKFTKSFNDMNELCAMQDDKDGEFIMTDLVQDIGNMLMTYNYQGKKQSYVNIQHSRTNIKKPLINSRNMYDISIKSKYHYRMMNDTFNLPFIIYKRLRRHKKYNILAVL